MLRVKGQERLKRVNEAYERLRKHLAAGGGALCTACGEPIDGAAVCAACQRQRDLDEREKRTRQRETELRTREQKLRDESARIEREGGVRTLRSADIAGSWFNGAGMMCFQLVGTGPQYHYAGGLEQGTAHVSGSTVTVSGRDVFGDFVANLTVDGQRLHGTLVKSVFGMPLTMGVEFWRR